MSIVQLYDMQYPMWGILTQFSSYWVLFQEKWNIPFKSI
mgnify:CR=1 FL=1